MKSKSQGPISSELDAKEKLIVYVYEYLTRSGAKRAAQAFLEDIQYEKSISFSTQDGPGFLFNWFVLFWDLYVSTKIHEPKPGNNNQVEPTSEARAFVEYHMRPVMSPHHQTSPPQPSPYMSAGPRGYGPPPPQPQPNHSSVPMRHGPPPPMNVGPPRMQMGQPLPPPQMGGPPMPHSHGPPMPPMPNGPHHGPPPQMIGGAPSPRYATHSGHMTPVPTGPEPGPSPGLINRMTPNHSGSPHPHMVGGPTPGPPGPPPPGTMHPVGMASHSPMSQPGPPPMQQRGGPGPSGWQGGYGSPAEQCFMPGPPVPSGQPNDFGGMMMNDGTNMMEMKPPQPGANNGTNNNNSNNNTPANMQQDDYVLPNTYGQPSDQGGDEIMKIKESLESNQSDQTGFSMDPHFADPQGKW